MRAFLGSLCLTIFIAASLSHGAHAQSGRNSQRGLPEEKKAARPEPSPPAAVQEPKPQEPEEPDADEETVRIDTKLVTVPVVVSMREGAYVPDLRREEFSVSEDGVEQEVSFFAAVKEPFHVVLMLDTSASTQEKLGRIQGAAAAFVEQLQPADRVKVISFDDRVYDLCDFTSDRALSGGAIARTRPGRGTKLYDAFDVALRALRRIEGRKAVVLFTDGVDWTSDRATYERNRRELEESGVIVYPIRYDTREETEELARRQAAGEQTIDLGTILGGPSAGGGGGTTPPSFPGGTTTPPSGPGGTGGSGPLGPLGTITVNRRRTDRDPDARYPRRPEDDPFPGTTDGRRLPDATDSGRRDPRRGDGDSIDVLMDRIYRLADEYLDELAVSSGGRLLRADTLGSLPRAFAQIAEELRTQYSLGYYPKNTARDGKYRRIRVRTTRRGAAVRARPGYRPPAGGA